MGFFSTFANFFGLVWCKQGNLCKTGWVHFLNCATAVKENASQARSKEQRRSQQKARSCTHRQKHDIHQRTQHASKIKSGSSGGHKSIKGTVPTNERSPPNHKIPRDPPNHFQHQIKTGPMCPINVNASSTKENAMWTVDSKTPSNEQRRLIQSQYAT